MAAPPTSLLGTQLFCGPGRERLTGGEFRAVLSRGQRAGRGRGSRSHGHVHLVVLVPAVLVEVRLRVLGVQGFELPVLKEARQQEAS